MHRTLALLHKRMHCLGHIPDVAVVLVWFGVAQGDSAVRWCASF